MQTIITDTPACCPPTPWSCLPVHSDGSASDDDDAPSNARRGGRATVSDADRYYFTMHEAFPSDFPATEVGAASSHSKCHWCLC